MNALLFQLIILQTLNCQALNNLCSCLSCSIFVLQSKLTEFSAILTQQQIMTTHLGLLPTRKVAWNEGNVWQNQSSFIQSVIRHHYCSVSSGTCIINTLLYTFLSITECYFGSSSHIYVTQSQRFAKYPRCLSEYKLFRCLKCWTFIQAEFYRALSR